jgi:hypothetical protein
MAQTYETTGELADNRTVKLDQALPAAAGKVRVTVELVTSETRPDLEQFMERMWEAQRRRGHVPKTKQEIDAYLNAERDSWDS